MLARRSEVASARSSITWVNRALTAPLGWGGTRPAALVAWSDVASTARSRPCSTSARALRGTWLTGSCGPLCMSWASWAPVWSEALATKVASWAYPVSVDVRKSPDCAWTSTTEPTIATVATVRIRMRTRVRDHPRRAAERRLRRALGIPRTIVPVFAR